MRSPIKISLTLALLVLTLGLGPLPDSSVCSALSYLRFSSLTLTSLTKLAKTCPYGNDPLHPYNNDPAAGPRNSCHEMAAGGADWMQQQGAAKAWMVETFAEWTPEKGGERWDYGHTLTLFLSRFDPSLGTWQARVFDPQTHWISSEFTMGKPKEEIGSNSVPKTIVGEISTMMKQLYAAEFSTPLEVIQVNPKEKFRWFGWDGDETDARVGIAPVPPTASDKQAAGMGLADRRNQPVTPQTMLLSKPHPPLADPSVLFDSASLPDSPKTR